MKRIIKYLGFGAIAVALGVAGFAAQQNATPTVNTDDTTMANIEAISQIVFVEYDSDCFDSGLGCTKGPYHWRSDLRGDSEFS